MASHSQFGFQGASSTIMEELIKFHDHALMVALEICSLVLYLLALMLMEKLSSNTVDAQEVELIWTILPANILVLLALPSLQILYTTDEIDEPDLTLKAIGHQWYWTYEYTGFKDLTFDSYMTPTTELPPGHFQLLEADHCFVVPTESPICIIVTADDVLHSWAIPSLGGKTDAIPGRLNQTSFITTQPGIFYGQCSEICAANHSYMPFVAESTPLSQPFHLEKDNHPPLLNDMPQLNPSPWFFIMLLSWLNFCLIIQPKLLPFIPTNSPSDKTLTTTKTTPWTWLST